MNFKPVGDKVFPLRPSCTTTNFPRPLFIVTSTKRLKTPSCCQIILELNLFGGICKNALQANGGYGRLVYPGRNPHRCSNSFRYLHSPTTDVPTLGSRHYRF